MFTDTEQQIIELHRGHHCETWQLILEDRARAAVNRTTYHEWEQRHGTIQRVPGGHQFLANDRGGIDRWAYDGDTHNGPQCAACDNSWCEHCNPEIYDERCPAQADPSPG